MKKILILAIVVTILVVSVGVSVPVALAIVHPLRPGHVMFPVQSFAEQARIQIIFGDAEQAAYLLELANRRTDDLFLLSEGEDRHLAANYLNQSLERLIFSVKSLSGDEASILVDGLQNLILKIGMVIDDSEDNAPVQLEAFELLRVKIITLEMLLSDLVGLKQVAINADFDQMVQAARILSDAEAGTGSTEVPPHNILFPPGSPGAEHAFFLLEGAHEELECLDCHEEGQYAGTPNLCIDCHIEQMPEAHYGDDCAGCHSTVSWQEANFDHALLDTSDCQACHLEDSPDRHYAGQCSACHNSEDWEQADFNHQAIDTRDCQLCHANDKPDKHYRAQCSACHNTHNWRQTDFNHQAVGATDCKACHSGKKPNNHYGGQCSACHNTTNWSQVNFNHQAVGATDCKACHSGRKPANHYSGQCSACHRTSSWSGAKFNHGAAGATDCTACHSGMKPANHFGGQCSACHSTSKWSGAQFNHGAAGATDCKACHSGKKPANH